MRSGDERPKRLWVAAILNTLTGLVAIGGGLFFIYSDKVPAEARPAIFELALGIGLSVVLVVGSGLALMGKNFWRYVMLVSAAVFYGMMVTQNVMLLAALPPDAESRLYATGWGTVVRSTLYMALTVWALFSAPSRRFFGAVRN